MNAIASKRFSIPDEELEHLLHRYTNDFTAMDRAGRFDPITGREEELDHMVLILLQRMRKNILLLGNAGVGKTALFVGLSQLINQGKVPDMLKNARIIELQMSMIAAGSPSRSDLEGRLIPIIKGVAERNATRENPPIIFCIDEIHQLMIEFKASSYAGIADLLKPYLTAGDIFMIGATTRDEYDAYIQREEAMDRRFQKIFLAAPDVEMTKKILYNMKGNFEKHYNLSIGKEDCDRIVRLTDRYIRNRTNPDKSILALDLACAHAIKRGITGALDAQSIEVAVAAEAGVDFKAIK